MGNFGGRSLKQFCGQTSGRVVGLFPAAHLSLVAEIIPLLTGENHAA